MAVVCKILNSSITAGASVKYLITNGTLDTLSQSMYFYLFQRDLLPIN